MGSVSLLQESVQPRVVDKVENKEKPKEEIKTH